MEEIVDIVDSNSEVLYQETKLVAHEKGLLHPVIIGMVRDSQKRWVLVKQSADRQDPGLFVSPVGGHIKAGESEEGALKRETKEEIGVEEFTFQYIGKAIFNRNILQRQENHYFIFYEIYTDEKFQLNHEAVSYKSFTEEELRDKLQNTPELFGGSLLFVIQSFYSFLL